MEYKNSKLERDIEDVRKSNRCDKNWLYSEMIADITKEDDIATDLARRVIRGDIEQMLEKIQSLFQRETANCNGTDGKTNIDILVEWLEYINPDEF